MDRDSCRISGLSPVKTTVRAWPPPPGSMPRTPHMTFAGRAAPDAALQAVAERHIGGLYRRLEALRCR